MPILGHVNPPMSMVLGPPPIPSSWTPRFSASHGCQLIGMGLHGLWVPLPMSATTLGCHPFGPRVPLGIMAYGSSFPWVPMGSHCPQVPSFLGPNGPFFPTAHSLGPTAQGHHHLSMTHKGRGRGRRSFSTMGAQTPPASKTPNLPLPKGCHVQPHGHQPISPPVGPKTQEIGGGHAAEAAHGFVYSKKSLLRRL